MDILNQKWPEHLKEMSDKELGDLADYLRDALLKKLSRHGGHIGPNLGFVEPTIALLKVFDVPKDKIVYDVSHQSYIHKMLTGRLEAFVDPDKYDTVSGFTNPKESDADLFIIGHTSTAVSLAGGLVKARELTGEDYKVVAVVGDGSLSGGEAFEGLNNAATLKGGFIIVVNDNEMSIAENHGGLYESLRSLRETNGEASDNYFKALGLDYRYVAYGNDISSLVKAFEEVKDIDHPVVVHIHTQKGMGYAPAEANKEAWHFGGPFDLSTGQKLHVSTSEDYGTLTAEYMLSLMQQDEKVVVITAGTPGVIGFTPERRKKAGRQFVDVGIAEQEAVAIASGLAKAGCKPFFGVVSSFIQRAYDQLSQDVAINGTSPVFGIFAGTVYGMNDVTHLGWFDISLISNIPGFVYLAPTCSEEYFAMLDWAMNQNEHPVAVRVPGVKVIDSGRKFPTDYSDLNAYAVAHRGDKVAIIAAGTMFALGQEVLSLLKEKNIDATLINPRFLSGIDSQLLLELTKDHQVVITIEDGILDGGFGEKIARFYGSIPMKVQCYGLKKKFLDRYNLQEVLKANRLTSPQIVEDILNLCNS
ncbi:MAG: 1-deoxy-D-xylulose-5-phosphate synthase [Bacteroides sp.]|nr:1-deoxy-D-xylulose-5-phosphate synthase [Bacteroides sp.]